MYCTNCGAEVTGNFCSSCGSKVVAGVGRVEDTIDKEKPAVIVETKSDAVGEAVKPRKTIFYYVKLVAMWYMCVAFIVSGISVLTTGVSVVAGVIWIIAGIAFCPIVFKDVATMLRVGVAVVLMFAGAIFMP